MHKEHYELYIVSDRLYVLGGEAVSYRERGAYHDHDNPQHHREHLQQHHQQHNTTLF